MAVAVSRPKCRTASWNSIGLGAALARLWRGLAWPGQPGSVDCAAPISRTDGRTDWQMSSLLEKNRVQSRSPAAISLSRPWPAPSASRPSSCSPPLTGIPALARPVRSFRGASSSRLLRQLFRPSSATRAASAQPVRHRPAQRTLVSTADFPSHSIASSGIALDTATFTSHPLQPPLTLFSHFSL